MSPNQYPPPEQIPSAERQRRLYVEAVKEITHLRKMVSSENIVAKEYKHDRDDLKGELKSAKRSIVTLAVGKKRLMNQKKQLHGLEVLLYV
jgi:predicted  nucleic acid-binding Zn-ribbon protein